MCRPSRNTSISTTAAAAVHLAYGIAADNNLQYTPKLLGEQDAYCTRIIALNPENRQCSRYCEYEQHRTPDT